MPGFSPFVLIVGMIVSFAGTSSWDGCLFVLFFCCFGLSLILSLFHGVCSASVFKAIRYETCLVNTLSNSWGQLTPRHAKQLEVGWNARGNGIVCLDMIIFSFQPSIFKVGTMCEDDKDITFRVRDLGTLSWCFCCTSHEYSAETLVCWKVSARWKVYGDVLQLTGVSDVWPDKKLHDTFMYAIG